MPTEKEIEAAVMAMRITSVYSSFWTFEDYRILARAALEAAEKVRGEK